MFQLGSGVMCAASMGGLSTRLAGLTAVATGPAGTAAGLTGLTGLTRLTGLTAVATGPAGAAGAASATDTSVASRSATSRIVWAGSDGNVDGNEAAHRRAVE